MNCWQHCHWVLSPWNDGQIERASWFMVFISGWLLCPLPEVLADVQKNHTGTDWNAIERLFCKLLLQPGVFDGNENDYIASVNLFWTEFKQFQSCSEEFGGSCDYNWATTTDLVNGSSYL